MTTGPVAVRPETPLVELKAPFEARGFNAFPVVDPQGLLRGIVSKLDFLMAFRPNPRRRVPDLPGRPLDRVEHIMGRGMVVLEPDEPVVKAIDLMIQHRLRTLPVVERRQEGLVLLGLVSRNDLLRCLCLEEPAVPAAAAAAPAAPPRH